MVDVRELQPELTQGAKGPSTRQTHTPHLFILTSLLDARELCGGTSLPHMKKEICASRPQPNPFETKTRPTSSEEATPIIDFFTMTAVVMLLSKKIHKYVAHDLLDSRISCFTQPRYSAPKKTRIY